MEYNKINRVGEYHLTNQGYLAKIIEYFGNSNCTIQFENGLIVKRLQYSKVKNGAVRNLYHPSVYGVGYFGIGKYKSEIDGKATKMYVVWKDMLRRCYDKAELKKYPTYIGCSVADEWKCFQNLGDWFEENWNSYMKGWHLDKDILKKGNKIYSPETCCFIPPEINTLLIKCDGSRGIYPLGVYKVGHRFASCLKKQGKNVTLGTFDTPEEAFQAYKTAKEEYIKEVADIWKPLIQPKVYRALYNYKVEIND